MAKWDHDDLRSKSDIQWPLGRVMTTEQYVKETGGDLPQKRCPDCGAREREWHADTCPHSALASVPAMAIGVPDGRKTATEVAMDGVDQPAHYARRKMQAIEYIAINKLEWWEANVVKYCARWDAKDGLKDLYKARSYLDMKIREIEGIARFWEKPVATERKLNGLR